MMSKSAGRNEEMHFLYQAIVKIILYLVVPHYVLVGFIHYLYRPRLALMIYRFKQEIMERKKLLKSFKIQRIFEEGNVPGTAGYQIREMIKKTIDNHQLRGFIDVR